MSKAELLTKMYLRNSGLLYETQATTSSGFFSLLESLKVGEIRVFEQVRLATVLKAMPHFEMDKIISLTTAYAKPLMLPIDLYNITPVAQNELSCDFVAVKKTGEKAYKLLFIELNGNFWHNEGIGEDITQATACWAVKEELLRINGQTLVRFDYEDCISEYQLQKLLEIIQGM